MWQAVKEKRCIHWEHWSYDSGFETEQENSGNISSLCNVASLQQVNVQWSKVWPEPQFYPLSFYFTNFRASFCNSFSCSLVSKLFEFIRFDLRIVFYTDLFRQIDSTELLGQPKLICKKRVVLKKNSCLYNYSRVRNKLRGTFINFWKKLKEKKIS